MKNFALTVLLATLAPATAFAAVLHSARGPPAGWTPSGGGGGAQPATNPGVAGWTSSGCVSDSPRQRTLSNYTPIRGRVTVAACVAACQIGGYSYAGLESGNECWCGKTVDPSAKASTGCSIPCGGNRAEACGGYYRLNLYSAPAPAVPACAPLRSDGYGLLANGGFEAGFDSWVPSISSGEFAPALDTDHELEGCNAARVTPTSSPAAGSRVIKIAQTVSQFSSGKSYLFTGFQGRLPGQLDWPSPTIEVAVGAQVLGQVTACSGTGCDIQGPNGSRYTQHTIPFTYEGADGAADLSFTVSWDSTDADKGNPALLFDGFNLKQE